MKFDHILIDGDLLLWKVTTSCETEIEWGDGFFTRHSSMEDIKALIEMAIEGLREELGHRKSNVVIALSGSDNFRKELDPSYKGNRTSVKPIAFRPAMEYLRASYECREIRGLEADDVLGILATSKRCPNPVIVTDDKDLLQIPGYVWRPRSEELIKVSPKEGYRQHMVQTLTGDRVDNYPGCPRVGEVGANKLLQGVPQEHWWDTVVGAFTKAGLDEDEALLQARLAKILTISEYDRKQKVPKLWAPKKTPSIQTTT